MAQDVIELLVTDHNQFRDAFAELEATTDPGARRRGFDLLARGLAKHEAMEEQFVHPMLDKLGPEADTARRMALAQEREAKHLVNTGLRRALLRPGSHRFASTLDQLRKAVERHADYEENHVFPLLRENVDADRLHVLAALVSSGRHVAPTRPHPSAPQTPGKLALMSPVVGVMDRMRDVGRLMVEMVIRR